MTARLPEWIVVSPNRFHMPGAYARIHVLFPHLPLVLAFVANCGPVRRKVVVQPYAKIIVHGDVALLRADSFGSSVPQEDTRRTRVRAQLYPVLEILQQLIESDNEAVNGAGFLVVGLRLFGGSSFSTVDGGLLRHASNCFAEPLRILLQLKSAARLVFLVIRGQNREDVVIIHGIRHW